MVKGCKREDAWQILPRLSKSSISGSNLFGVYIGKIEVLEE